jgi:acyl-CoA reductase-like NAD-dependent aldehyde dehydrogenase
LHRSKVLSKLARLLEERIPEFAELETMQTGRTIREMKAQLGRLPEWLFVTYLYFQVTDFTSSLLYRDYFSALLRTHCSFVAPTQGKLLNYVERVPLGVVAQIIVGQMCEWSLM